MNDIPDWAGKRACELLNAEVGILTWNWPINAAHHCVITVAKLVMQHEQPPADPDEEAVKRIMAAWFDDEIFGQGCIENLARAVSQYKQEKANG